MPEKSLAGFCGELCFKGKLMEISRFLRERMIKDGKVENGISRAGIEITWDFFCLKLNLRKLNKFDCARFSIAQSEPLRTQRVEFKFRKHFWRADCNNEIKNVRNLPVSLFHSRPQCGRYWWHKSQRASRRRSVG